MSVLIDSSVWIEYFRNGTCQNQIEFLIDENLVVTNELILTELIPFLRVKNHRKLVLHLSSMRKHHLTINWVHIREYQYECLKNGINGIGIPDLIIAQNAIQNDSIIYSHDNHFVLLKPIVKYELFAVE